MAGKKRLDVDSETALAAVSEERDLERIKLEKQSEREGLIAQSYELAGQIKAAKMFSTFGDVTRLMWLKQIKESRIYRDLPNIGTWEDYCNYLGLDRHTVDQDLLNLTTFGEQFLVTVTNLRVGYRDLRKLRQLTHDGTIQVMDGVVEIAGEKIPLDEDHKEDLQAAIEKIGEEQVALKDELKAQQKAHDRVQEDTRKSMVKLQKDLDKLSREAKAKDLSPEEDAFLQQVENLSTTFQGYMLQIRTLVDAEEVPGVRAKTALVAFLNQARMELNAYYDAAYVRHAASGMAPEEEWIPPFERGGQN